MVALKRKLDTRENYTKAPEDIQLTYDDIKYTMESKFPPDQAFQKQLWYLASYGYIKQEDRNGTIYITIL